MHHTIRSTDDIRGAFSGAAEQVADTSSARLERAILLLPEFFVDAFGQTSLHHGEVIRETTGDTASRLIDDGETGSLTGEFRDAIDALRDNALRRLLL